MFACTQVLLAARACDALLQLLTAAVGSQQQQPAAQPRPPKRARHQPVPQPQPLIGEQSLETALQLLADLLLHATAAPGVSELSSELVCQGLPAAQQVRHAFQRTIAPRALQPPCVGCENWVCGMQPPCMLRCQALCACNVGAAAPTTSLGQYLSFPVPWDTTLQVLRKGACKEPGRRSLALAAAAVAARLGMEPAAAHLLLGEPLPQQQQQQQPAAGAAQGGGCFPLLHGISSQHFMQRHWEREPLHVPAAAASNGSSSGPACSCPEVAALMQLSAAAVCKQLLPACWHAPLMGLQETDPLQVRGLRAGGQ